MEKGIEALFRERMLQDNISPEKLWEGFKKNEINLVPVIAQDFSTREVLMLAYMDREAFLRTIDTGIMHYHSRSRNKLWMKGESSGNIQRIIEGKADCDKDTLLFLVDQEGPACHTGKKSCFYRTLGEIKNTEGEN